MHIRYSLIMTNALTRSAFVFGEWLAGRTQKRSMARRDDARMRRLPTKLIDDTVDEPQLASNSQRSIRSKIDLENGPWGHPQIAFQTISWNRIDDNRCACPHGSPWLPWLHGCPNKSKAPFLIFTRESTPALVHVGIQVLDDSL